MPNVAGREFAYTPQGMAAAEQYKQSLGMRGGGMMGFRPVGYADGDLVEAGGINPLVATGQGRRSVSNAIDTVKDLVQKFSAQAVSDPVKEAVNIATYHLGMPVDLVNSALEALGIPVSDTPIGGSRNLKEIIGMGAPADLQNLQRMAPFMGDAPDSGPNWFEKWVRGWPSPLDALDKAADKIPYGGLPTDKTHWRRPAITGLEWEQYKNEGHLKEAPLGSGVTESPGFEPETGDYFPPQMARGGYVGRGTSAGELAPRGSMSVREAGETMYELAKRRRGMRGGGIMSLRR